MSSSWESFTLIAYRSSFSYCRRSSWAASGSEMMRARALSHPVRRKVWATASSFAYEGSNTTNRKRKSADNGGRAAGNEIEPLALEATELLANRPKYPFKTRCGQFPDAPGDERFAEREDLIEANDAFLRQSAQLEILGDQAHGGTILNL